MALHAAHKEIPARKGEGPNLHPEQGAGAKGNQAFWQEVQGPFDYIIAAWERRLEKARTGE